VRTSPGNYQVQVNFTIRGVTKTDALNLTTDSEGKGVGEIEGTKGLWPLTVKTTE